MSSILGCSRSHIYRVAQRFVQDGLVGLADRRADNGEVKLDDAYEIEVLVAVAFTPQEYGFRRPTWTLELLSIAMCEKTGVRLSTTSLSRFFARAGVRHGSPKPIVECPWKKAAKTRRLQKIQQLIETVPSREVVLYVDEVDIHLNPKIGRDWMLPGHQKTVLTPGKNEKRYLAGALQVETGQIHFVSFHRKTSDLFLYLLKHLLQQYPDAPKIHLILDNFRIHSSKSVKLALAGWASRIQLHFLPPYCPDHNRIERLWKDLHDNVTRNHRCRTIDKLMQEVRLYLDERKRIGGHCYLLAA
jgi:transposase